MSRQSLCTYNVLRNVLPEFPSHCKYEFRIFFRMFLSIRLCMFSLTSLSLILPVLCIILNFSLYISPKWGPAQDVFINGFIKKCNAYKARSYAGWCKNLNKQTKTSLTSWSGEGATPSIHSHGFIINKNVNIWALGRWNVLLGSNRMRGRGGGGDG